MSPKGWGFRLSTFRDALGLVTCLASPSRGWDSRPHVAMVRSALGHELAGVGIVPIPRLLASVQRSRVGVSLFL